MVGKKTKISKYLNSIIDKPYKVLETDCATIVKNCWGDVLPGKWEEITFENWPEKFEDHEKALEFFISYLKANMKEVKTPSFGDVVILEKINLVGIYIGNNTIVTSLIDKGVKAIPIKGEATYLRWEK